MCSAHLNKWPVCHQLLFCYVCVCVCWLCEELTLWLDVFTVRPELKQQASRSRSLVGCFSKKSHTKCLVAHQVEVEKVSLHDKSKCACVPGGQVLFFLHHLFRFSVTIYVASQVKPGSSMWSPPMESPVTPQVSR